MTIIKIPFFTIAILFLGAALIWIWEFGLAAFGDHGMLSWAPLIAGIILLSVAYFELAAKHHRP